jgi:ABC-type lipoprotein export system ATPase subunit
MLEAKNIHKVYTSANKELRVLKGINLSIERGKFIALVGPSGAGKSTLLHILGGLDAPSEGVVLFKSQDIYKLDDSALCRIRNVKLGFVFQFYHLLSEFTVLENVLLPALISVEHRAQSVKCKEKATALLNEVGLAERADHFPSQLSGGEQQRAAIARALINDPEILLCDEPTGNLDSQSGLGIISLLKKINTQNRMTVILVTHNLELAKISDKIYYLRDGILVS